MGSFPTAGAGLSGTQSFWLPRDLALNSGQQQASHSAGLGCPGRNGPRDAAPAAPSSCLGIWFSAQR